MFGAAASVLPGPVTAFVGRVVVQIINPIILLLGAGAFIAVIWGIVRFVAGAGDEDKRKEGREAILWGFVGLIIIFGAYGLINLVLGFFNLGSIHKITP